jgi:AcrR family transcriptional regulator
VTKGSAEEISRSAGEIGSGPVRPGRARNASATRDAILHSAVEAFTRHGYDGVGVREIAAGADVTAMMVNRYFGSKEQLFAAAVDESFGPPTIVGDDPAMLARDAAVALAARTSPGADQLDPFLLLLRSAPNPRAAEIMRDGIHAHVRKRLTTMLGDDFPGERIEMLLAVQAGVWLMRSVIGTESLRDADPAVIAELLESVFNVLTDD